MTDDVRMQVLSNGIISKCSSRSTRPIFRDIASFVIVFGKLFKIFGRWHGEFSLADKGIKSDGRQRVRHGRLEISAGNWPLREWVIGISEYIGSLICMRLWLKKTVNILQLWCYFIHWFSIKKEIEISVLYGKFNKTRPSPIANM